MVMVSKRDKQLSVWTALLVASVLTCPLWCRALSCRDADWSEDRIQDLESRWITSTNATLTLQAVYTSVDRDTCARFCCQITSGNCTATGAPPQEGSSSNSNSNGTCYLYSCSPAFPFCVFTSANGTDAVLTVLPLETTRRTSRILASTPTDIIGDGTQSKGRKGVLSEVPDDLLLKHDNTTIKPRKGVLKAHSVNGRKGVEKDPLVLTNELFSDELINTNSSIENNSSLTTVLGLVEDLANETHSEQSTLNTATTQSLKGLEYTRNFSDLQGEDQGNVTLILISNSTLRSTQLQTTPSIEATEITNTPTMSTVPSSKASTYGVTEMIRADARLQDVKESVTTEDGDFVNWEINQSNTAMHLVIGLVLGLMVLLTVIGVVAKRVHDSWQRRHYHRMDFLIDGMYHGNA